MRGVEEINEIKQSVKDRNTLGIVVGILGVGFLIMTAYSLFLSVKVNKLNIKKLNAEGFK